MTELNRTAKKSGNSTVIVLDKTLQELSGFKVGEKLIFNVEKGKITITKNLEV